MSRSWLLYLGDLIESAEKIERIWEVATEHVPRMLTQARRLRDQVDDNNPGTDDLT